MRKFLSLILITILCLSLAAPCISFAATVKLNKTKLELEVGDTYTLKLSGTSGAIKWSSSKKSVAIVSSKGKVTAVKEGKATVTATCNKKSYKCTVTVSEATVTLTISDLFIGGDDELSDYLANIKTQKKNDDFTTTYTMTKSQQSYILELFKKNFSDSLKDADAEVPDYYKSITPNDDFTSFDIIVDPDGYANQSSDDYTILGIMIYSGFYQAFLNIDEDEMRCVIHIYDTNGSEIDVIDSDTLE